MLKKTKRSACGARHAEPIFCISKRTQMNDEKQIALAIIDGMHMYYESLDGGRYTRLQEDCLKEACQKHGLSANMWFLLNTACSYPNDMLFWAREVLGIQNDET